MAATTDIIFDRPTPDLTLVTRREVIVASTFFLVMLFAIPLLLGAFWLQIVTSAVIYASVTLGLGLLAGRVGMVSLYHFVLVAVGAWAALRIHFAWSLPFPLTVLTAGIATALFGTVIGLPALRLSGLYLALMTLMGAGGLTVVLRLWQFPNGGPGFQGREAATGAAAQLPRPNIALGDTAYYRFCLVAVLLVFLLVLVHLRTKPGRAWAALRQGQTTAIATGVNTTLYRLWAFALASFTAGIAGALLTAAAGGVSINQFPVANNILLFAVVLMGGVYTAWGAVVGAFMFRIFPALLDDWGVSTEWLTVLFGIGVIQVLLTAPGGLAEQIPKDAKRLILGVKRLTPSARPPVDSP